VFGVFGEYSKHKPQAVDLSFALQITAWWTLLALLINIFLIKLLDADS
jgi:hypothetical protein